MQKFSFESDFDLKWRKQNNEIKKHLKKSSIHDLFNDPYFQPEDSSNHAFKSDYIKWLRPRELAQCPELGIESVNCNEINQGSLDDCGLISACCAISKYTNLINNLFQAYNSQRGYVKLKLYLNNKWTNIYIDDKLPTSSNMIVGSNSANKNHFWLPFIEKAFAKIRNGYEKLIGIDSAYALSVLTGGIVLRLNPNYLNDREPILHYLNESKTKNFMVAIAGCELIKENELVNEKETRSARIGHAYALLDVFRLENQNKTFIKMRNCQTSMKIQRKTQELNTQLIEPLSNESTENEPPSTILFSFEEFFKYFEVFNILVSHTNYLKIGCEKILSGKWEKPYEGNQFHSIENCLRAPIFIFEVQNKDHSSKQIVLVVNLLLEDMNPTEYTGIFVKPVRTRKLTKINQQTEENELLFIDFNLQTQAMLNANPLTQEIKLRPGIYLFGLVLQSSTLPKSFVFKITTTSSHSQIRQLNFNKSFIGSENYFHLTETNQKVKLILPKCCVCECLLSLDYITSGAKAYCNQCYNSSFKCNRCDAELGQEYFTIEQSLYCAPCLKEYSEQICKTDFNLK